MITKDQASSAIKYLEAAAQNMHFEDEAHKAYNDKMRKGAVNVLKEFVKQANQGLTIEQKNNMITNWMGTLKFRFGGLDFWRLSKK